MVVGFRGGEKSMRGGEGGNEIGTLRGVKDE